MELREQHAQLAARFAEARDNMAEALEARSRLSAPAPSLRSAPAAARLRR